MSMQTEECAFWAWSSRENIKKKKKKEAVAVVPVVVIAVIVVYTYFMSPSNEPAEYEKGHKLYHK